MPPRLPPLSALRLFEAAGRHQSFKRAAAELHLTPSAVSHGIVGLEQTLGVALFTRSPQGLSLTPEGVDYLAYVTEAFSLLLTGTRRLPTPDASRAIAITCAPTFASRWLLPRLETFVKRMPNVDITVDTSRRQVGFPTDGFDFAIRLSRAPVASDTWHRLFSERFVPVCSPAYHASHADAHGRIDLRTVTRIHVSSASEDWQGWIESAGIDDFDAQGGLSFDSIQMAFEAAMTDLGVVIGRRPLVDEYLASGALVPAHDITTPAQGAYWLICAHDIDPHPECVAFREWVIEQARPPLGE
ncbi:LysR substrate-binding domain-containing protein [Pandoraea fibrosis]|uniref:Transcriptional regulator n=1 Tax=Pandoraea fibrosis TaxID=1891094 RepID=A0A5E4SS80_9BURK|nr:LysR substrate-binding domain-containing protein [Pandoraea fibrosis]QHE91900.1 LysR family transcriptional regulator [Pandoraea fibrosis]QHF14543.1 LysR family transcriptional regulator [Pandoraea fibrosis]VVD77842.1 transcriptional regulator [Pandoraea fibrosis]